MVSNSMNTILSEAIDQAKRSEMKHHLGATVFKSKNKVISSSFNSLLKGGTNMPGYGLHAELSAIYDIDWRIIPKDIGSNRSRYEKCV